MNGEKTIETLAEIYQQLYLDPDTDEIGAFRKVVLEGEAPRKKELKHFRTDPLDREETVETPAGKVQVVFLRNRQDFEVFIRCMMAAKEGPEKQVPSTVGASTLVAFNWPRIYAHREKYMREQRAAGVEDPDWSAEFSRFISVRENYQDMLVVLSWGPYSDVTAEKVGQTEENWAEMSYIIRKYHELTHVICRRIYPDRIEAVWDELVADAIGIVAAFGRYDAEMEARFLGIVDGEYRGGRLETYTDDAEKLSRRVNSTLNRFTEIIREHPCSDPFELIPVLQEYQSTF